MRTLILGSQYINPEAISHFHATEILKREGSIEYGRVRVQFVDGSMLILDVTLHEMVAALAADESRSKIRYTG